jgi:hypothetical protein
MPFIPFPLVLQQDICQIPLDCFHRLIVGMETGLVLSSGMDMGVRNLRRLLFNNTIMKKWDPGIT